MLRTGITISTVRERMNRYNWWKLCRSLQFDSGEENLIYKMDGSEETLVLYFGSNKRLARVMRCE